MKLFPFLFTLFFFHNCLAGEYFCNFKKKVDSISFVESSEIVNSPLEENQAILRIINEPLQLRVYEGEINQTIRVNGAQSIVKYKIVKDDGFAVTAVSKKNNFTLFFDYSDLKVVFSEFHDAGHVANYFYTCKD